MRRRTFVTGALGLALGPALIRDARAASRDDRVAMLFDAYRRARRAARPLLVVVIPEVDRGLVGRAWGDYINRGSETQLAPLAIFEPACATPEDLARLAPQAKLRSDTRLAVIGVGGIPAETWSYEAALAAVDDPETGPTSAHVMALAGAVRSAARALPEVTKAPMNAHEYRLRDAIQSGQEPELTRARLAHRQWEERPPRAIAEAFPLYLWRSGETDDVLGAVHATLADIARARFRDRTIPGSVWARTTACGAQAESEMGPGMPCGVARTPPRSARFLWFYTHPRAGQRK